MSSMRQQQWNAKNIFCKQKSIDDKTQHSSDSPIVGSSCGGRRILQKQLSVDHVTSSLKHSSSSSSSSASGSGIAFGNLFWPSSPSNVHIAVNQATVTVQNHQLISDPNLKITSAIKKRAQFAGSGALSNSINKQDLLSSCLSKNIMMKAAATATAGSEVTKAKDKINIKLFLSHDVVDDGGSDIEHSVGVSNGHKPPSSTTTTPPANTKTPSETSTASGKLSVSARRAQFQTSRRIMSAPIRPLNQLEDAKNKRKPRKKKVIRDKELDESADEYADEVEDIKTLHSYPSHKSKKAPPMRSRSVLGCDQMGIETLVSMINSGESDSEKEDGQSAQQQQPPPPMIKNEPPQRIRANMLRKTVSFQEDDSQLQAVAAATGKDAYNNFRRAPIVPFAGRMRNTRSLFGQEICNLYMNSNICDKKIEEKNENDLNSSNQAQEEVKEKPKLKKFESFDEKKAQEILTQPREEECWRLYEKMKKTGLNISYDTILRGILKPSELRLLEKQKKLLGDIEEKPSEVAEITKVPAQE